MTVAHTGGEPITFLPFSALVGKSAVRMRSPHRRLPFPHRRQGWQSSINGDWIRAAAQSCRPQLPRPDRRPARVPRWCSSCWPRPSTESARFSSWSSTKAFSPATGKRFKVQDNLLFLTACWLCACVRARGYGSPRHFDTVQTLRCPSS